MKQSDLKKNEVQCERSAALFSLVLADRCAVDDRKAVLRIGYVVQFISLDDGNEITVKYATSNMFDVFQLNETFVRIHEGDIAVDVTFHQDGVVRCIARHLIGCMHILHATMRVPRRLGPERVNEPCK